MRVLRSLALLACLTVLMAVDTPDLSVPADGEPAERVLALWNQTKPILLADAGLALSDGQALTRGRPLVEAWTALEADLAASEEAGETHAVLKLINDLYGRPGSTPERRMMIRNQTRRDFGPRLQNVEQRLLR
jgi:hypothetical protein